MKNANEAKLIDVFVAQECNDDGFAVKIVGVFTDQLAAKAAGKGLGGWGSDSEPIQEKAVLFDDGRCFLIKGKVDLDKSKQKLKQSLKTKALAKLSEDEIQAIKELGI
jgi:hypothetical protein